MVLDRPEIESLLEENAALRAELLDQWEYNHFEHCGRTWPHAVGQFCGWPRPDLIRDAVAVSERLLPQ